MKPKDYEAFEQHHLDHWAEQGYVQANTKPNGEVMEGEPMHGVDYKYYWLLLKEQLEQHEEYGNLMQQTWAQTMLSLMAQIENQSPNSSAP
jgi:hypothetical protein